MIEISRGLFIGSLSDYQQTGDKNGWAFVHATQSIHYSLMGWDRRFNKPDKNHPNYIVLEDDDRLSLNWVDGEAFLYNWSGPETFVRVLDFIDKWLPAKTILVHCDQGQSRSPTLGLLYLAKRMKAIPQDSFQAARQEFVKLYPYFAPGGIGDYATAHWAEIN